METEEKAGVCKEVVHAGHVVKAKVTIRVTCDAALEAAMHEVQYCWHWGCIVQPDWQKGIDWNPVIQEMGAVLKAKALDYKVADLTTEVNRLSGIVK